MSAPENPRTIRGYGASPVVLDRPGLENFVIYELHVGAYSPEGIFEGVTLAR